MLHRFNIGGDDVTDAPPGHGEGLREGVDHQDFVVTRAHEGDVFAFEHNAVVDFIRDDPQVVLLSKRQQSIALFCAQGPAGRVAWKVVEDSDRVFIHQSLEVGDFRNKFVFKQARVILPLAPHKGRVGAVQGEVRLGEQHVFAGVHQRHEEVEQGVGAGHGHADVVLVHTGLIT